MARAQAAQAKAKSKVTKKAAADRQAKRAAAAPALMERIDILDTLAAAKRRKEEAEDIGSIVESAARKLQWVARGPH